MNNLLATFCLHFARTYTQKYCSYCALLVYGYFSSYYYSIGELAGKVFGVSASSTVYLSADIATVSLCIQREGIS